MGGVYLHRAASYSARIHARPLYAASVQLRSSADKDRKPRTGQLLCYSNKIKSVLSLLNFEIYAQ